MSDPFANVASWKTRRSRLMPDTSMRSPARPLASSAARERTSTVRHLRQSVKEPAFQEGEDESWKLFVAEIPPEYRAVVEEVMSLKEHPFTAAALRSDRVEAVCQETLGELAALSDEPRDCESFAADAGPMEEWLEETTQHWALLDDPEKIAAPGPIADFEADARQLDAELRHYYGMRDQWDEHLGHLAMVLRSIEGWRVLGFLSFEHYCAERLGMHPKTVRQRAALEEDLLRLPALREAMRGGVVSYEKARLIAPFGRPPDGHFRPASASGRCARGSWRSGGSRKGA